VTTKIILDMITCSIQEATSLLKHSKNWKEPYSSLWPLHKIVLSKSTKLFPTNSLLSLVTSVESNRLLTFFSLPSVSTLALSL
jgi:hypothetical protein